MDKQYGSKKQIGIGQTTVVGYAKQSPKSKKETKSKVKVAFGSTQGRDTQINYLPLQQTKKPQITVQKLQKSLYPEKSKEHQQRPKTAENTSKPLKHLRHKSLNTASKPLDVQEDDLLDETKNTHR